MKLSILIILSLFAFNVHAQSSDLSVDCLKFKSKRKAEKTVETLWQIGYETEVFVIIEGRKKYYIVEIQDLSILDLEGKRRGKWVRYFKEKIKKRIIRLKIDI
ncbi:MAG: hypothetical protein GY861_26050 [bacterium]|nr:hypothetical protein [bacterium]